MLAQAWQFAAEGIAERPAPCDVGGYVVAILDPFHKIFASAGGTYVEYDTSGDHIYNPTGLLRIHVQGGHPQLGPSDGCAPKYSGKDVNVAAGPMWQDSSGAWRSLAAMNPPPPRLTVLEETPDRVAFRVSFAGLQAKGQPGAEVSLTETITVEPAGVTVRDEIAGDAAKSLRISYPMLIFDGARKTEIDLSGNTLKMRMDGRGVKFDVLQPADVVLSRSGKELPHRNGIIEPIHADISGRTAVYRIQAW